MAKVRPIEQAFHCDPLKASPRIWVRKLEESWENQNPSQSAGDFQGGLMRDALIVEETDAGIVKKEASFGADIGTNRPPKRE